MLRNVTGRILLTGMVAAFASIAQAQENSAAYVMTVIDDRAAGDQVISGAYSQAIESLTANTAKRSSTFAASNNLCVAYTKTNRLSEAEQACSTALRTSKATYASSYDVNVKRDFHAVALSNRGVIRAVSGNTDQARQDFKTAMKISTLTTPAENLAVLETKTAETVSALQ
jgi:predicted negative regulator of RcsB-dependent stress response